jgi:hypothetical protein
MGSILEIVVRSFVWSVRRREELMLSRLTALSLAFLVLSQWVAMPAQAGHGCGCEYAPPCYGHWRHHCHHKCCHHGAPMPPAGPVVQSMAAPNFAVSQSTIPLAFASQFAVVPTVQAATFAQFAPVQPQAPQAQSAQSESSCQASSSRLAEMEERVEALRSRVNVLQTSIDNQTELLQAIITRLPPAPAPMPPPAGNP